MGWKLPPYYGKDIFYQKKIEKYNKKIEKLNAKKELCEKEVAKIDEKKN